MNVLPKWQVYKEKGENTAPDPILCGVYASSIDKRFLLRWEVRPGKVVNMLELVSKPGNS